MSQATRIYTSIRPAGLLATALLALTLGACAPSLNVDGNHIQPARYEGPGNSSGAGGMFGAARGVCNEKYIGGCGGLADKEAYRGLGAQGRLLFTNRDTGEVRPYVPAGTVTIGPISAR